MTKLTAMKVLITGGAGYIGSTVATACIDAGIDVVVLDDLSTGMRAFGEGRNLYVGDIADAELVRRIMTEHPDIDAVVHCAARIVVPESVADPLGYYDANVGQDHPPAPASAGRGRDSRRVQLVGIGVCG